MVTRKQALAAGCSPAMVQRRVESGRWRRVHPGVYASAAWPWSPEQALVAACLAAGPDAVASHRAAAWLHELVDDPVVEITVPRPQAPVLRGAIVHRSLDLTRPGVVRHGVPTTDPLRSLADLGAVVRPAVVADAVDRALARRLVTVSGLRAERDRLSRQGRSGVGVLGRVLDARAPSTGRAPSVLESRAFRLWRRHGLPDPVCEHEVQHGGRFFLDFAWPDARYLVEVDGWSSRASAGSLERDNARQNALVDAGWFVHRFTWDDVVRRGPATGERVAVTYRRLLGSLSTGSAS